MDDARKEVVRLFEPLGFEKLLEAPASFLDQRLLLAAQGLTQGRFGAGRDQQRRPFLFRSLILRGQDLDLIARTQTMAQRHKLMVDLGGYTVGSEKGMEVKGHIEHCRAGGQRHHLPFRGEHHYLAREEIELQRAQKVYGVGVGIVENLLDSLHPLVELGFFLAFAGFVAPVSGKALLGDLVHPARTYLNLYPVAIGAHKRYMESLIAVRLRGRYPVAGPVGMRAVEVCYG